MVRCSVYPCLPNGGGDNENRSYHRLPKNASLRNEWIKAANDSGFTIRDGDDQRVCSRHFEESAFEYKHPLLAGELGMTKKQLKEGVVPFSTSLPNPPKIARLHDVVPKVTLLKCKIN